LLIRGKTIEIRVRTMQRETTRKEENRGRTKRGTIVLFLGLCYMWVTGFEKYYIRMEKGKGSFYALMIIFKGRILMVVLRRTGLRMIIR